MSVDPITGAATVAGKVIAEKAVKSIVKKADNVGTQFGKYFEIEGQEMTVLCPEGIQRYSISLTPKTKHKLPKNVRFPYGNPRRIELRQVRGLTHVPGAIEMIKDGFRLNLKPLIPGEMYILDIEYDTDNPRFIESLVDRSKPKDVPHRPGDNKREYEMSAQLKHLGVLKQKYYNVNLRDVDFIVDVAVHQDVKTTIPGIFRQEMETLVELTKKKGRSEKFRLMMRHMQLQKHKYGGRELDILRELYDIFTETEFRRFVEVLKDFNYCDCKRGSDFYDMLPFPTWPKSMKVTSRTDLNLEKPAADGILVYKNTDFIKEIEKIFGLDKNSKKTKSKRTK